MSDGLLSVIITIASNRIPHSILTLHPSRKSSLVLMVVRSRSSNGCVVAVAADVTLLASCFVALRYAVALVVWFIAVSLTAAMEIADTSPILDIRAITNNASE